MRSTRATGITGTIYTFGFVNQFSQTKANGGVLLTIP